MNLQLDTFQPPAAKLREGEEEEREREESKDEEEKRNKRGRKVNTIGTGRWERTR